MTTTDSRTTTAAHDAPPLRPAVLWFGVLGGGLAWAVHEVSSWSTVELTCRSGHAAVIGLPLRRFAVITSAVPAAVALAALVVAVLALRSLRGAEGRTAKRAHLMATVGFWLDALSLLMILFGGAAVLVLHPCGS